MTTFLVVDYPDGHRRRCDASCHNAARQGCDCPCGGRYHGKEEGSTALYGAFLAYQEPILAELGVREQHGELWIAAYRASPDGPLRVRPKGTVRAYQEELLLTRW